MRYSPVALMALLIMAGCGGGEKRSSATGTAPQAAAPTSAAPTTTTPTQTETAPSNTTTQPSSTGNGGTSSPETQPGGAGDEESARTEVTFVGNGGRITPTSVRVAPFIQIKVRLLSRDKAHYAIQVAGRTLEAGQGRGDSARTIPGLRQEKSYTVAVTAGSPSRLKITGSSEPGP
ncbi:MAG: hypothetical protein ACJ76V_08200 [Thermoleophilaceae bacterium]